MKTPFRNKLNLKVIEIELKNGRIIKNYPDKGYNLSSVSAITEHLNKYGVYEVTLGNYKSLTVYKDDVKTIR